MERIYQMLGVLAVMYVLYALSVKKWNYQTEAQRNARRQQLKELGLSNTFYFIHAGTLWGLNLISGGLFTFYWIFKQWQAILQGFKRLDGTPLKGGVFVRTLGGVITFFSINTLIIRICEYMRKKTPLPAWIWGTAWLAGLGCAVLAHDWSLRFIGYAFWCGAPAALQRRLNGLLKEPLSPSPKMGEIFATVFALVLTLGILVAARVLLHK